MFAFSCYYNYDYFYYLNHHYYYVHHYYLYNHYCHFKYYVNQLCVRCVDNIQLILYIIICTIVIYKMLIRRGMG